MNILITGVGGPSPKSVSRSLKFHSKLKDIRLFGTDSNKYAYGLYDKSLYKKTFLVPRVDHPDYWKVFYDIIRENNIEYAIILPELEVIEWSKISETQGLPCKVLLPDHAFTNAVYSKAKMTDLLRDSDLVPRSYVLKKDLSNLDEITNNLGYPFWIRSSSGSMGLGSLKIDSKETLKNWLLINPNVEEFFASDFLPGRNLACKMLYWNGKLVRAACGERVYYIMSKVAPSGITGNTSFGRLLNDELVFNRAKRAMDSLFEKVGAKKHGFYTVDLKEDNDGLPYVTEVNIRHVAFSICFTIGGMNFAEDTIRLLMDDPSYDKSFRLHQFAENDLIFLRDVDSEPLVLKESQLF
ncbi:MAG: hypothetical protein K9I69_04800 [Ignavibacteriales bacterium]|nr:hypothetical protein [Ignavibacteriales bacterium]MCF8315090.1 hypothetical protein [Ignavibacteriales bacterium]MCF8435914.1 hypothetical protein [Ignavibacteriales bacterium]